MDIAALRSRLAREVPNHGHGQGDHALTPALAEAIAAHALRDAAVLIPIVPYADETGPRVILTRRSAALRAHTGQIAFPGGRIDPEDSGPVEAALREAEEEIALERDRVEPIGQLPDYLTGSGYRIRPIVGLVRPDYRLVPNPAEVDSVFEVPLSFLMTPENHRRGSRVWNGQERFFWEMPFGPHYIWGVTAGIIRMFYEQVNQ